MSSLESDEILFLGYFQFLHAGGKLKHSYTRIFFVRSPTQGMAYPDW
jgi:hypothetical protein